MRILLNGENTEIADGSSIQALLVTLGISYDRVAVELNAEIVPKANYEHQLLTDDDKIEIVHFVGGG